MIGDFIRGCVSDFRDNALGIICIGGYLAIAIVMLELNCILFRYGITGIIEKVYHWLKRQEEEKNTPKNFSSTKQ